MTWVCDNTELAHPSSNKACLSISVLFIYVFLVANRMDVLVTILYSVALVFVYENMNDWYATGFHYMRLGLLNNIKE